MKLNPQQAPLYGRCVITVQLCDEELAQDEEGVDYFLLFAGSTQRHLTSTLRSSHDTLQALCPAHDCCEEVWVTLCSIKRGVPEAPEDPRACPGPVTPLAEHRFCFVQDLAFDMAQFLVSTAGRADGLEGALMLDECQIPLQECERLDESLALALDHLRLPPGWSLLGNKKNNSTDLDPQETLLHFAARRGLTRVALFLLQQAGAREALQLPNRQGHTPSAIAALREHHHLHQLLTQAGVDTEKDVGTETAHPVSADSRVVCHLPRLNTHTLTLGIYPDRNPPTLQRIVEQLQHLICHLHAKGVSTLDLQSEFLHTGTECCDGVGTETAFSERLKQTTTASEHLHSSTEESWIKNGLEDGSRSSVGGGDGEAGNEERDWELCASPSTSVKRPPDHGLGPPEDWVCLNPNTERDYSREEEEEGREQLVFADQSLTLCDRSEEAQSETEGESLAVGTPPTAACGKQTEETDRGDAVIREGQEATEGKERAQQEAEESTARREEEKEEEEEEAKKKEGINLESKDPTAHSGNTAVSAMGQSQSLENSEESDTSDSDMKDCSKEVGDLEEEMRYNQELCDRISLDREKPESEGLMDPTSTPEDLPNRSLIECGDVMQEEPSESAGQCPVIVGLHKGEPPLDINSLEQNQETAVRDYSTVQQWDLADGCSYLAPETECHFGDCTGADSDKELDRSMSTSIDEQATVPRADIGSASLPLNEPDNLEETYVQNTADFQTAGNSVDSKGTYLLDSEASSEIMPSSGKGYADLDSGTTQGFSSDEEDSFRSVGSSTTEIFQSTQEPDRPNMEEQDPIKTNTEELVSVGNKMAELDDMKPGESNEHLLAVAPGLPSDHSTVSILTVTDCGQAGSEPESQLSPSLHTIEPLSLEGTGEKLAPEISKEDMSLGLVLSESGDRPTVKVAESQCESAEDNDSKPNLETLEEHSESEVTDRVLFELKPSVAEGTEITGSAEEDTRPTETSNNLEEVLAKDSGETDLQLVLQQLGGENSEMTANERSVETDADEGLRHSSIQISMLSSEDITSNSADVTGAGTEPLPAGDGAFSEPPTEEVLSSEEVTESPRLPDAMDGASYCHFSPIQEMDVDVSEDLGDGPREDKDGPEVEEDSSMIHRDKEASFLQPSNTQLTGSSQSTSPSLTSITSRTTSCPSTTHRDSGSDTESFLGIEAGDDSVFRKGDVPVTGGDSTSEVSVSCSSTDDTASVCPSSSSPEGSQGLGCSWSPEESSQTGSSIAAGLGGGGGAGAGGGGEAEDEAKDRVTEVPRRLLRPSVRSLSPLRRHSWGPGKNNGGDAEMNQRSSIRSPGEGKPTFHRRSYSLEGLSEAREQLKSHRTHGPHIQEPPRLPRQESEERGSLGSLVSLTEEQEEVGEHSGLDEQKSRRYRPLRQNFPPMTLPLTKSVSMLAISQRDIDAVGRLRRKRRISFSFNLSPILNKSKSQLTYQDFSSSDDEDNLSMRSFSSTSGSVAYSISEEEPGPLRSDTEGKSVTKVSRTFSYLKNKMYKKTREKDREKREKDKEGKEKDKRTVNGHLFTPISSVQATQCSQCNKALNAKEAFHCTHCNACVHKSCRDGLPACAKVKMKFPRQQFAVPDSSSVPTVTMRNKSTVTRERPWSAILSPEDHSSLAVPSSRRHTSIMPFHGNNLSKSLSISNIAGPVFDDMPIKGLRYLSQSTDSLNRTNQVTESMESLTDEGTEMMDGQLMGEFEAEVKELEADSWSFSVDQQYLQQLDRELVKRQDVIYELMQTEMHHIRTLRIMSEVYSKGLQKEVQLEAQTLERLFPVLDELLEIHTQHLLRLLERKRESQLEGGCLEGGFIINRIGDILVSQFSGSNAESMKRVYGRFCSRHNEAVHFYKELLTKEKRFKAFIKKKMSSTIVRRLGIPECILLVTQRITKYPVLFQRLLQHTKVGEEDYDDLTDAVRLVKEVIAAVDGKVNEHEKKRRLKEFHSRMDSKSIMMMKSGQMFAREDLLRRRLFHDGALQLKNSQGRLKDVHALLLSDVLVFLQEKDQKYVFALLDQRSTVISLQKLIVREVANEERGLFLITAGIEKPEMMEVLASSKEERNTWMQLIQGAMQSIEKDEDEGIPSETEDDKRQLETKAKEMRDMLRQKDAEIMSLLEEKVKLFRGMWEGLNPAEDACRQVEPFFRSACGPEPPRGATIMRDALQEVETLQELVNGSLGGAMASVQEGGGAGSVCLPRRAETFGGFDSHQMSSSKNGDKDEGEDMASDLRRTESDSVLKKGGNANLLLLLKRNSEQVLHSVSNLHLLLSTLQAVVVQQDSFIEDQRQALSERSSSCTSLSRPSSRPSSLIEQEKQRSLEKQRQELASLQRQQAAHVEEKRRREKDWELREEQLTEREMLLHVQEEEIWTRNKDIEEEKQELQSKKEEYQRDLERLRDAQRKLDREREAVQRQLDKMEELRLAERTPSSTSDDSPCPGSSQSLELDLPELDLPSLQPHKGKPKGKNLNPFTLSSANPGLKSSETPNQVPNYLLQLAKNKGKDRKEKKEKKKKSKGGSTQTTDPQHLPEPPLDGEIFFC